MKPEVSKATIALIPPRELAHIQRLAKKKAARDRAFLDLTSSLSKRNSLPNSQMGGDTAYMS